MFISFIYIHIHNIYLVLLLLVASANKMHHIVTIKIWNKLINVDD